MPQSLDVMRRSPPENWPQSEMRIDDDQRVRNRKEHAMTHKKPNTGFVIRAARAHICPHCPLKWGPERASIDHSNPCELECNLFQQLPAITNVSACADPMLRSVKSATAAAIRHRVAREERGTSP